MKKKSRQKTKEQEWFQKALANFPKIVKQKERAAREKKKIMKAFLKAKPELERLKVF